jgi:hypothetical protein
MARADQLYTSRYLKESDLRGRDVTVTIRRVDIIKIGDDTKPVAFFEGKEKGLVLNKTMFNAIAKVTGELDSDNWPGHKITLYPTETEFKGDTVACIRIRLRTDNGNRQPAPLPPPPPPPVDDRYAEEDDEEIPF